jgi:hypothetical protein
MWIFQISGYPENKSCKMDMVLEIKPSIAVAKEHSTRLFSPVNWTYI